MFKKKDRRSFANHFLFLVTLTLIITLLCSTSFAQVAVPDGVYSFGDGRTGELGLGDTKSATTPTIIQNLTHIKTVEACYQHSLVLLQNGDVYSFGDNSSGRLGLGDAENRSVPTKIQTISGAKAIAAGNSHSLIILQNGDVYSFGNNAFGQLGHGDKNDRLTPTKIQGLSNAIDIAGGQSHSLVLLKNGHVYAFGYSGSGQLGQGDGGGINHMTPLKILENAKAIAAEGNNSMVLMKNGDVYTFGSNRYGQLGYETSNNYSATPAKLGNLGPAKAIAAGTGHSLVLLENGDLYSFGQGDSGQLGHGNTEHMAYPSKVEALSGVKLIAAGTRHSLVVLDNGNAYSFGLGFGGRLGHGDISTRSTPTHIEALSGKNVFGIAAGYSHSLALLGTPPITININGIPLYTEVPPIIINGRTMVPLRAIFEALDMEVEWIAETRTIIGTTATDKIQLTVDSNQTLVNNERVELDVPATIIESRTLVPVRFIGESTGREVKWDGITRTVDITNIEPGDIFTDPIE
ncbi:MAG: hypothetical protein CVU95_10935 [Firmicutes bacterium HGW-Firmicutes-2]|jgi:alpha-tubulin suppressor-like RCC1 family protein|nr:MAG: hypothetical protein CVU95_10935 [Firmicutes bacterium HGW-Firmicutes-2]